MKLLEAVAHWLDARNRCDEWSHTQMNGGNVSHYAAMVREHTAAIEKLCADHLPRGSGFDRGTKFDFDKSTPNRLVFTTAFHHMDDNGFYDGWTYHEIVVKPAFVGGFLMIVKGRDYRQIKDLIADTFHNAFNTEV